MTRDNLTNSGYRAGAVTFGPPPEDPPIFPIPIDPPDHKESEAYLAAAQAVADARVAEATAFLRFKIANKGVTDKHAQAQAIVETQSALDVALAKLELARRNLIAG